MPFTVNDFQDLLRLLDRHPEWQEELRRRLLSPALLSLPELVQQLAEGQRYTSEQLGALSARVNDLVAQVQRLTARVDDLAAQMQGLVSQVRDLTSQMQALARRVDELTERLERLTARVDELAAAQLQTERAILTLTERVDRHTTLLQRIGNDLARLKGRDVEALLRERPMLFSEIIESPEPLAPGAASAWLEALVQSNRLTRGEGKQVSRADLFVRGRRDRQEGHLVVEVSWTIEPHNVVRARDRAQLLRRAGAPAWPVVAGYELTAEAAAAAERNGVLTLIVED